MAMRLESVHGKYKILRGSPSVAEMPVPQRREELGDCDLSFRACFLRNCSSRNAASLAFCRSID